MRLNIGGICPAIPPKPKARFAIPCTWFPSKCANPAPGTRSAFEDDLSQLGVKIGSLRIQLELPSNEAVRAAVEAGLGATAISASVAARFVRAISKKLWPDLLQLGLKTEVYEAECSRSRCAEHPFTGRNPSNLTLADHRKNLVV